MKNKFLDNIPLKDYKRDANGKYVYTGDIYKVEKDKKDIDKLIKILWIIILIMFILEIIAGAIPFKGMIGTYYLIIPYGIELIMVLGILWANFYFSNGRYGLTNKQYKKSIERFQIDTIILMIFSSLSFILSIVYIILNGFDKDGLYFGLYLMIKAIICVLGAYIYKNIKALNFKTSPYKSDK